MIHFIFSMFRALRQYFKPPRLFLIVVMGFFVIRIIFIGTYPPFNDESIHIAWARYMVENPGARFISMVWGGKQPLPFWLFGWAERLYPSDPFFAGRIVSLIVSFLSLIGVYFLTNVAFSSRKAAFWASVLFVLSPMSVFFGTQVLMEPMLFALSTWLLTVFFLFIRHPDVKKAMLVGILAGIGFWIKSSVVHVIFLILGTSGVILFYWTFKKQWKNAYFLLFCLGLTLGAALIVVSPLLTNPAWPAMQAWNARYGFTFNDFLAFPIREWSTNVLSGGIWYLFYLTPLFLVLASISLIRKTNVRRQDRNTIYVLAVWGICWFFLTAITVRQVSSRYFYPASLPLFPLAGFTMAKIMEHSFKGFKKLLTVALLFFLSLQTAMLVVSPPFFFGILGKITPFANESYLVSGWESGYGLPQAIGWIKEKSKQYPMVVITRQDGGNPEDAILAAFWRNKRVLVLQINPYDPTQKEKIVSQLATATYPTYFVSRGRQYAGLELYLHEEIRFPKPWGDEFVGIYKVRPYVKVSP